MQLTLLRAESSSSCRQLIADRCRRAVMALTVLILSLFIERLWVILPHSPYFQDAHSMALTCGVMSFGGVIAFLMVWTEFTVIAQTSALTFMVAGTFKELVTGAPCLGPACVPAHTACEQIWTAVC